MAFSIYIGLYACIRKRKNHKGILDPAAPTTNINHNRRLFDDVSRLKDNNTYIHIHKLDKYGHIIRIVAKKCVL